MGILIKLYQFTKLLSKKIATRGHYFKYISIYLLQQIYYCQKHF